MAVALWAAGLSVYEWHLRDLGHEPTVIDSSQLWAQERSRVYQHGSVIFIGASRTLYGVDLATVQTFLPHSNPVMLALNGRYPLATLESLAGDPDFNGTLLVDVDARGLTQYNWNAQASKNAYFAEDWTPNWAVHRWLLSALQAHGVALNSRLSLFHALKARLTEAPSPFLAHDSLSARREGYLNFDRVQAAGLAEMFRVDLEAELKKHPPPLERAWLEELAPVAEWVRQIEARGGRVIFFVPPVAGHQATLIDAAYPRERYWQRFIDRYELKGWHFQDDPELFNHIELPDQSHVDARQKAVYTERLLNGLRQAGWL